MHLENHAFDMLHIFLKCSSSQLHTYFHPLLSEKKVPVRLGQSRLKGNKTCVVMYQSNNSKEASELHKKVRFVVVVVVVCLFKDHCLSRKLLIVNSEDDLCIVWSVFVKLLQYLPALYLQNFVNKINTI